MRGLLAIILGALLNLPWATKLVITVDFFVHQDYIAENLCENRDQPELHCDGKCILMQKLQMAEEPASQPKPLPEILQFEISGFILNHFIDSTKPALVLVDKLNWLLDQELISSQYIADVFHPPRFRS